MSRLPILPLAAGLASVLFAANALSQANEFATTTDLANVAQAALAADLRVKFPGVTTWAVTPLGSKQSEIGSAVERPVADVIKVGARSAVRLTWIESGQARSRIVWFDVVSTGNVWVAARDLAFHERMTFADVKSEARDVIALNCQPLITLDDIGAKRTTVRIQRATALCAESLEPAPLVGRGDQVTIRYLSARVVVEAKGIAQQDGQLGTRLRVVVPASRDSFIAAVSGVREVTVHD